jgi:uracil-DNA glycosylase family 4
VRYTGPWPDALPRRAADGSDLRRLQERIPTCPDGARPVLSGDGREQAMLIGQAPGWREIEIGLPFAGDAGKRLVGWLELAGMGAGAFREGWYVTSVGKCYPGRAAGSSVDKPPSRADVALWGPYLVEELRLVEPRLVVLVGGLAHRFAYGPGARLDQLVGRELTWADAPGASVICLPHPSGASTWLNAPDHVELWRRGIELLGQRWLALRS